MQQIEILLFLESLIGEEKNQLSGLAFFYDNYMNIIQKDTLASFFLGDAKVVNHNISINTLWKLWYISVEKY